MGWLVTRQLIQTFLNMNMGKENLNISKLYNSYHSSFLLKLVFRKTEKKRGGGGGGNEEWWQKKPQQRWWGSSGQGCPGDAGAAETGLWVQGRGRAEESRCAAGLFPLHRLTSPSSAGSFTLNATLSIRISLSPITPSSSHYWVLDYKNRRLSIWNGLYNQKRNDVPQFFPLTNCGLVMWNSASPFHSKGQFSNQNFLNIK